jgi:hypothetical protein
VKASLSTIVVPTIFLCAAAIPAIAADTHYWGSNCTSRLTLDDVTPLLEKGLCKSGATFLGKKVCDDWHAFLAGCTPAFAPNAYVVGATFRVELAKNGSLVWSEKNPLYVIYNQDRTMSPTKVGILDVSAESPDEEAEATRYIESAFSGTKRRQTSLDEYIKGAAGKATQVVLQSESQGQKASLPGCGEIYVRSGSERQYALILQKRGNAWESESHPIIYFSIFPSVK